MPDNLPAYELMPLAAMSPTMETGGIARWEKEEGDEIAAGDIIMEVETDKASVGFEAQDDSVLAKILIPAGASGLEVGTPVCPCRKP